VEIYLIGTNPRDIKKRWHLKWIPAPLANLFYLSHSRSLFSFLSASRPNSRYHGLFCIHSFTSLQPCSAITPAILRSSSEKLLFTVGCLFCVAVQLMVIIFNLAVISVFHCLIRFCKGWNKHIYYRVQLFIPVGSLSILASLFGPFLKVLNTRHEFIPLGDFFKHINVLFGQCRKERGPSARRKSQYGP